MKLYIQKSILLALLTLGFCSAKVGATTGSFAQIRALNSARRSHTATLLANGRVLVAGGADLSLSPASFVSAELYDPVMRWMDRDRQHEFRTITIQLYFVIERHSARGGRSEGCHPSHFGGGALRPGK